VVGSERALPEVVRAKLREMRAKGQQAIPRAVYVPGDGLYFVAPNIASTKEALLALAEEAIGHHGLRAVMGPQFDALLDRVIKERKADVEAMAADYGLDMANLEQAREAADEFLAHQARLDTKETWFQGIVQAIRQMLRKMGVRLRLSDGDIRELLAASNRYVTQGDARGALKARGRFGGKTTTRNQDARFSATGLDPVGAGAGGQVRGAGVSAVSEGPDAGIDAESASNPLDADYFAALERGDMETAKRMVVEAALESGALVLSDDSGNVGYKVRRSPPPKKTITVYKAFRMRTGGSYPMFVGAKDDIPIGIWLDATEGGYHFKSTNGIEYVPADTGDSIEIPDQAVRDDLIAHGYLPQGSKAKSVKAVAYRPGWHGGELPFFPQAGNKVWHKGKKLIPEAPDDYAYPNVHEFDTFMAEVEMDADYNYLQEYLDTAARNKDGSINHKMSGLRHIPKGGFYEYATNPLFKDRPDLGKWYISGSVRINKVLTQDEVNRRLDEANVPRQLWNKRVDVQGRGKNKTITEGQFDVLDLDGLGYDPQFNHVHHKLLDPVTYDDNGQVIPLSQRFDRTKADVRFSLGDIRSFSDIAGKIEDAWNRKSVQNVTWWDRTVGTPRNLALKHPETFGRVYDAFTRWSDEVSTQALNAQSMAPSWIANMEGSLGKALGVALDVAKSMSPQRVAPVVAAINDTTRSVKHVMNEAELRGRGLDDKQIALYNQAFRAAHHSLDQTAQTLQVRALKGLLDQVFGYLPKRERRQRAGELARSILSEDIALSTDAASEVLAPFIEAAHQRLQEAQGLLREAQDELKTARQDKDKKRVAQAKEGVTAAKRDLEAQSTALQRLTDTMSKIEQIGDRTQQLKDEGYFPLIRFGRFTVTVWEDARDENGEPVMGKDGQPERFVTYHAQFEKEADMHAEAKRLQGLLSDTQQLATGTRNEESHRLFNGLNMDTLALFVDQLDTPGIEGEAKQQVDLLREYIRLGMADTSALKRTLQRGRVEGSNEEGIPGFSTDTQRVLASYITSNARLAATNLYGADMRQAIDEIPAGQGDLAQYGTRLMTYLQNPQEEFAGLRNFMFFWYLGGSLSSAAVNLSQVPMVLLPYMTQFKGFKPSMILSAYQVAVKGRDAQGRWAGASEALNQALSKAELEGLIAPQEIYNLLATARGGQLGGVSRAMRHPLTQLGLNAWASMFSWAEQLNRTVSFVTAYNLALKNGLKGDQAFELASNAVKDTQFVLRRENRPEWARGVMSPLFTFKQFTVNYLELLKRLPVKQQAYMVAVMILAAGATGLPGEEDLEDLIDTIAQLFFGKNLQSRQWLEQTAETYLGETISGGLLKGVSGLGLPINLQSRIGMGNIIPGTGLLKPASTGDTRDLAEIMGPAAGIVQDVGRAVESAGRGEYGRAGLSLMPRAIKNLYEGGSALDGTFEDKQGRPLMDVDPWEAIGKMAGFQPTRVATLQDAKFRFLQRDAFRRKMEDTLLNRIARARVAGKADAFREAQQAIKDWNRTNPGDPIEYSRAQIRQRVKMLKMAGDERFLRSVSPELRNEAAGALR
jgi:hypothetical protein